MDKTEGAWIELNLTANDIFSGKKIEVGDYVEVIFEEKMRPETGYARLITSKTDDFKKGAFSPEAGSDTIYSGKI